MLGNYQHQQSIYLRRIIENANQKHLKQSRIRNHRSLFNLLKVLSSYKEVTTHNISEHFKNKLYSRIIMITKYFNPQSYQQWIQAIKSIDQFTSSQFSEQYNKLPYSHKQKTDGPHQKYSVNHDKTIINELGCTSKEEDALENFKDETISQFDFKTRNKFWIQTKHRNNSEFLTHNSHNITTKNSYSQLEQYEKYKKAKGNLHYISFQPSEQIFEQNKQNIALEDNQPTRTPFSRSFIHNLPNSSGSPFLLSKITNNTKDATLDQSEQDIEEWKTMITRADIFYQINLKFKSFSALIANCQAFGEYRQNCAKAKRFKHNKVYNKVFCILKQYSRNKRAQKNLQKLMRINHQQKTMMKCFNILNVNYQLKINKQTQNNYIEKFKNINIVACQFLCHLLFKSSQNQGGQETDRVFSTPKSIRVKAEHFQMTLDADRMELLLDNFSSQSIPKTAIQSLFQLKKQSILRKYFRKLASNKQQQVNKRLLCTNLYKKMALKQFMLNTYSKMVHNSSNVYVTAIYSNKIKSKIFKAILEICVSKKIYQKRAQYIANKTAASQKNQIIKIWRQRCIRRLQSKISYHTRVQKSSGIISKIMIRKIFSNLCRINKDCIQQEMEAQMLRQKNLMKIIFEQLKTRAYQRRTYNMIKTNTKQQKLKSFYKNWNTKMKGKKFISNLHTIINKIVFNSIFRVSEFVLNSSKIQQNRRESGILYGLKKIKMFHLAYQKMQQQNIRNIQKNVIFRNNFSAFYQIVSHDIAKRKYNIQKEQIQTKTATLTNRIISKYLLIALNRTKQQKKQNKQYQQNLAILNKTIITQKPSQIQISTELSSIRNPTKHKLQFLKQLAQLSSKNKKQKSIFMGLLRNRFMEFRDNQAQKLAYFEKLRQLKKQRKFSVLKGNFLVLNELLSTNLKKKKQRQQQALKIYRKKLMYNCIEVLAVRVAIKKQKIEQIQKNIMNSIKRNSSQNMIVSLRNKLNVSRNCQKTKKLINSKHLLKNLKQQTLHKQILLKIQQLNLKIQSNRFLQRLLHFCIGNQKICKIDEKVNKCILKVYLMRLQNNNIERQIRRKTLYMAIKFHAIKIQRKSFRVLGFAARKQNKVRSILVEDHTCISKGQKIYEHISTEYSSI